MTRSASLCLRQLLLAASTAFPERLWSASRLIAIPQIFFATETGVPFVDNVIRIKRIDTILRSGGGGYLSKIRRRRADGMRMGTRRSPGAATSSQKRRGQRTNRTFGECGTGILYPA